ncbi:MAG: DUF86 domain-containing protein [Candidatus Poribacteria bacterium]|nr:DUF86 domain-containing protein [Candidatus Poribacteria bacterium]
MSNRTDTEFLEDIQEAIRRIRAYTHEMTYKEFFADTRTQDAVIRNLEIIGEATKKLSVGLRNRYPSVPWKEMAGARDRLIHNYFGVDIEVVWKISIAELSNLTLQIAKILCSDFTANQENSI